MEIKTCEEIKDCFKDSEGRICKQEIKELENGSFARIIKVYNKNSGCFANTDCIELVKELEQCGKKWRLTLIKYNKLKNMYIKTEIFNDKKQEYELLYECNLDNNDLQYFNKHFVNIYYFN